MTDHLVVFEVAEILGFGKISVDIDKSVCEA